MYGSVKYGTNIYGQGSVATDEIELYRPNLLDYLPTILKETREFKLWNDIVGYELALLNWQKQDLIKQCFIDTATWGLDIWEQLYGIATDLSKSFEDRREFIKAKNRGQGAVTKKLIKETAEALSGGEVEIIEHPEGYSFTVQFIGIKGIPKNMAVFKDMLDIIKPAHLSCEFKYTYTVWDFLKEQSLTWNNAILKTWNDLKVYEGE